MIVSSETRVRVTRHALDRARERYHDLAFLSLAGLRSRIVLEVACAARAGRSAKTVPRCAADRTRPKAHLGRRFVWTEDGGHVYAVKQRGDGTIYVVTALATAAVPA